MALDDLGFEAVVASNALEALDKLDLHQPQILIVDEWMPGLSGTEFVEQVRKVGFRHTPIIMISASRGFETGAHAAGATACLKKPFEIDSFLKIVRNSIEDIDALSRCS